MKSCELCMLAATTYCESDQASLCWDCDAKVHGANFLVARHVRCLLCLVCQTHTPWRATGFKLGHSASVCDMCVNGGDREESQAENDEEEDVDSNDDVEEQTDNQVVPWCTISNTPPPASNSSSSEDSSGGERELPKSKILFSLKRLRANVSDLRSQVDLDRLSAKRRCGDSTHSATWCRPEEEAVSVDSMRLSEDQKSKPECKV